MEKRTWCYIQQPFDYEMAECSCGNVETQWSEYKDHLWCAKCEKDFIPEFNGVFSGPIPIMTTRLLGLNFDRFNIQTEQAEILDESSLPSNLHYIPCINPYILFEKEHIEVDVKYFLENKFNIKKAKLSYKDNSIEVELAEELADENAKCFNFTVSFNYPNTKSFNINLSISQNKKKFLINEQPQYDELLKYINRNELKYILIDGNN